MKRCLVYDPYLATLGGGERYVYALIAELESSVEVTLAAPQPPDPSRLEALEFASRPITQMSPSDFSAASADYDIAVYLTNSPPPPSYATHSLLLVQFPFEELSAEPGQNAEQRHVLERYGCVVNSDFSREWLLRRWGCEATILYPPIAPVLGAPGEKGKLILSVGRFFPSQHSKRQDVLVSAFAQLVEHPDFAGWRLVLAGGVSDDADAFEYLSEVRSAAGSLPVEIDENVPQDRLHSLYREATFFWHATGFGRGAHEPERAEHFGMSTVEAMSYGAVPLVFADGGQLEIVTNDSGRLWRSPEELVQETIELVADGSERRRLARNAELVSHNFAPEIFVSTLVGLVDSLLDRESDPGWLRRDMGWARIELGRLRGRLEEARSELGRARGELDRLERVLRDTQTTARVQLEAYDSELREVHRVAQAQLDAYEEQLAAAREALSARES